MSIKTFSREDVEKYDGNEGRAPYIVIHNRVFDVTEWLLLHPGGPEVFYEVAGKDATDNYEDIKHSVGSRRKRMDFYVGEIVPEERTLWVRHRPQGGAEILERTWFDYMYNEHQKKPLKVKLQEVREQLCITVEDFERGRLRIHPHTFDDNETATLDVNDDFSEKQFPLQISFEPAAASASATSGTVWKVVLAAAAAMYIRKAMTSPPIPKVTYSKALRHAHAAMGIGVLTSIGSVQAAARSDGEQKRNYMLAHKSCGVLMLLGIFARIWLRLNSAIPPRFPGPKNFQLLEGLSHKVFYLLLLLLPVSGATFGYYSGTGVPFLTQGKSNPNKEDMQVANQAIDVHKKLGQLLEYILVPFHFATNAYHTSNGRNIVKKISPFL